MAIWTGRVLRGDVLTIVGGSASKGMLHGGLPEDVGELQVYAAQSGDNGLTVFTSHPNYAKPFTLMSRAHGRITFTFDPRHATDLTVFETPNPQNGSQRLVLRINTDLTACVIEWRRLEAEPE